MAVLPIVVSFAEATSIDCMVVVLDAASCRCIVTSLPYAELVGDGSIADIEPIMIEVRTFSYVISLNWIDLVYQLLDLLAKIPGIFDLLAKENARCTLRMCCLS